MNWLLSRLTEPSSYAGISLLLAKTGDFVTALTSTHTIDPVSLAALITAAVAIVHPEGKSGG